MARLSAADGVRGFARSSPQALGALSASAADHDDPFRPPPTKFRSPVAKPARVRVAAAIAPADNVMNERGQHQAASHLAGATVRFDLEMRDSQPSPCSGAVIAILLWPSTAMLRARLAMRAPSNRARIRDRSRHESPRPSALPSRSRSLLDRHMDPRLRRPSSGLRFASPLSSWLAQQASSVPPLVPCRASPRP